MASAGLFAFVTRFGEDFDHPVAVVAKDEKIAVLGCTAHAAAGFEQAGQFPQVGIRADETFDERDGLAAPLLAVEPDAQVLSFGGEGFDLRSLLGVVFEIRVGRIDHSQSRFPVVRHV